MSAICVYQELQPTPSGGRPVGLGTSKPLPLSPSAGRALNRAGSAKEPLKTLVTSPAYSIGPVLPSHARGAAARRSGHPTYLGGSGPHALGMFDLGTGGTALLVLLAVSSGLLAVAAAVRLIRR